MSPVGGEGPIQPRHMQPAAIEHIAAAADRAADVLELAAETIDPLSASLARFVSIGQREFAHQLRRRDV